MAFDTDAAFDASPDVLNASARPRRVEKAEPSDRGQPAMSRLRTIVERIERLEEDKAAVMADMKEVFLEARGEGYDVKILRRVIRIRAQDKARRRQEDAILDLYLSALGEV